MIPHLVISEIHWFPPIDHLLLSLCSLFKLWWFYHIIFPVRRTPLRSGWLCPPSTCIIGLFVVYSLYIFPTNSSKSLRFTGLIITLILHVVSWTALFPSEESIFHTLVVSALRDSIRLDTFLCPPLALGGIVLWSSVFVEVFFIS